MRLSGRTFVVLGAVVGLAIVLMKVVPAVPGSFTSVEWLAFLAWCALGWVVWMARTGRMDG